MAMFMNRFDVVETLALTAEQVHDIPNMYAAARVLHALMEWTDDNSDGWPYWSKPQKAAAKTIEMFDGRKYALMFGNDRQGQPLVDITEDELVQALRPIKAFLTRMGVNYDAELPWAALLPAA